MKNHVMFSMCGVFLALALSGCPQPTDETADIPSGTKGEKLKLEGQVYNSDSITLYTGDADVTFGSVTGKITKGKLSFEIGDTTPATALTTDAFGHNEIYSKIEIGTPAPNYTILDLTVGADDLVKSQVTKSTSSTKTEWVVYMYVSEKVTLTGTGKTSTSSIFGSDPVSIEAKNFKLDLKKGWNALYSIYELKSGGATFTIKLGDPKLKWVLD
jgi:hypothetical protein